MPGNNEILHMGFESTGANDYNTRSTMILFEDASGNPVHFEGKGKGAVIPVSEPTSRKTNCQCGVVTGITVCR